MYIDNIVYNTYRLCYILFTIIITVVVHFSLGFVFLYLFIVHYSTRHPPHIGTRYTNNI